MQKNQMKVKLLSIVLAAMFVFTLLPATAYANNDIRVIVDGQRIGFTGQPPVIVEGRTLVPLRAVFEQMGFEVGWNGAAQQITLTNSRYTAVLAIGSYVLTTNGVRHTLDIPPQIINNTTMLPIRTVLESVGYSLNWDSETSTIIISARQASAPTPQAASPSDWKTIEGPVGLSLRVPSTWEHDDCARSIRVIIDGHNSVGAARSDHALYDQLTRESIAQQSFLFDDGTVGTMFELENSVSWLTAYGGVTFIFPWSGVWDEASETWHDVDDGRAFFDEHKELLTQVARSFTVAPEMRFNL